MNKILDFIQNESGIYAVITALIIFPITMYTSFVIDGTGLIYDKIRFTHGLEQATLFITAENTHFRKNKNIYPIQDQPSRFNKLSLDEQRKLIKSFNQSYNKKIGGTFSEYNRNIEMISGIVRTYYQPYQNFSSGEKFEDNYDYQCKNEEDHIICQVNGSFERPSWLYLGETFKRNFGTFDKVETVHSEVITALKNKKQVQTEYQKINPIDVMLAVDLSGSMKDNIYGYEISESCWVGDPCRGSKFVLAKQAIEEIAKTTLQSNNTKNKYNRIGLVGYGYGVQLAKYDYTCVLPYIVDKTKKAYFQAENGYNYYENVYDSFEFLMKRPSYKYKRFGLNPDTFNNFEDSIDYTKTLNAIDQIDGRDLRLFMPDMMITYKQTSCLGRDDNLGKDPRRYSHSNLYWYDNFNGGVNSFMKDLNKMVVSGSTLTSSGVIMAANALAERNNQLDNVDNAMNPRKILIILSDGLDAYWDQNNQNGFEQNLISARLIDPKTYGGTYSYKISNYIKLKKTDIGLCDRIRRRLDSLKQDPNAKKEKTIIAFIKYAVQTRDERLAAYQRNMKAWKKCVGEDNFYEAPNYDELVKSLKDIILRGSEITTESTIEEVGTLINK